MCPPLYVKAAFVFVVVVVVALLAVWTDEELRACAAWIPNPQNGLPLGNDQGDGELVEKVRDGIADGHQHHLFFVCCLAAQLSVGSGWSGCLLR